MNTYNRISKVLGKTKWFAENLFDRIFVRLIVILLIVVLPGALTALFIKSAGSIIDNGVDSSDTGVACFALTFLLILIEYLYVIKGVATYKDYSRIHIFNQQLNCCWEEDVSGRCWQIMNTLTQESSVIVHLQHGCCGNHDAALSFRILHRKEVVLV